jgi:hypothetical protein
MALHDGEADFARFLAMELLLPRLSFEGFSGVHSFRRKAWNNFKRFESFHIAENVRISVFCPEFCGMILRRNYMNAFDRNHKGRGVAGVRTVQLFQMAGCN